MDQSQSCFAKCQSIKKRCKNLRFLAFQSKTIEKRRGKQRKLRRIMIKLRRIMQANPIAFLTLHLKLSLVGSFFIIQKKRMSQKQARFICIEKRTNGCLQQSQEQADPSHFNYYLGTDKQIDNYNDCQSTIQSNNPNQKMSGINKNTPREIKGNVALINQQNPSRNIEAITKSVGIIRSQWYNKNMGLLTYIYGTAFLVSDRILMTCTHNLYSRFRKSFADKVQFLPNIEKGEIGHESNRMRRSLNYNSPKSEKRKVKFIYSMFNPDKSEGIYFDNEPQKEEISFLILEQKESEQKEFISVGELATQQDIDIFGYPSLKYKTEQNFARAYVEREMKTGKIVGRNSQKHILNYTNKTSVGMSGSPILARNNNNQYYAIGIHTHRGMDDSYNSGVYFDSKIILKIKELLGTLEESQKQLKLKMPRFNEEVIKEVDGQGQAQSDGKSDDKSEKKDQKREEELQQQQDLNDDDDDKNSQIGDIYEHWGSQCSSLSEESEMSELDGIYEFYSFYPDKEIKKNSSQSSVQISFVSPIQLPSTSCKDINKTNLGYSDSDIRLFYNCKQDLPNLIPLIREEANFHQV